MSLKLAISALIVAPLIAGVGSGSSASAQDMIDASKITCEDFAFYKRLNPNAIAYWMSGYYHGKLNSQNFDPSVLEQNADKIRRYCLQSSNYKVPLMQVIDQQIGIPK